MKQTRYLVSGLILSPFFNFFVLKLGAIVVKNVIIVVESMVVVVENVYVNNFSFFKINKKY